VSLWSVVARFFLELKKCFWWIWMLVSYNPHGGIFWNFYHMLLIHHITRSYGYMCQKLCCSKSLVVVLEMAVLECFWWIHSHGTLGVNGGFSIVLSKLVQSGPKWMSSRRKHMLLHCLAYRSENVQSFQVRSVFSSTLAILCSLVGQWAIPVELLKL